MAKMRERNRTSGTARRKMSESEQIRYGMKTGKPLTGSASGVKSITLKEAGEALTQGIVKVRGKKLSVDPVGLAMAVSPFKILSGVAAKSATRLSKMSGFVEEEKAALDAALRFTMAAKFPKSAGAQRIKSSVVKEVLKVKATGDPNSSGIMNAVRLGGEKLWTNAIDEKAKKQAYRAVARIFGEAGRSDPSLRDIGKQLRKIGKRKY